MNSNNIFNYYLGSYKKYNENLLSDIIFCLWQQYPDLGQYIFDYIFPNNYIKFYFMIREFSNEKGRNDFLFCTSDGIYILESKIYDKNIEKVKEYLSLVKNNHQRIKYIIPKNEKELANILKTEHKICCVYWEDLINFLFEITQEKKSINIESQLFLISAILGYSNLKLKFKEKESLNEAKNKFNLFKTNFNNKRFYNKFHSVNDWENGNYLSLTDNTLWFCLKFCPIKGSFLCLCYDKKLKIDLEKLSKITNINNIRYLGDYFHDQNLYYEIINDSISQNDIEDIICAFRKLLKIQ